MKIRTMNGILHAEEMLLRESSNTLERALNPLDLAQKASNWLGCTSYELALNPTRSESERD